jgi:hypothetical protein
MKRWPTIPVAPRIPIGNLEVMAMNIPVYRSMAILPQGAPLWLGGFAPGIYYFLGSKASP